MKQKSKLNKCEKSAKSLLQNQWEEVYKIGHDGDSLTGILREKLDSNEISENNYLKLISESVGQPDFLAWNSFQDFKFVEVKSSRDNLTKSQMKWMADYGSEYDLEVWWFSKNGEKVELKAAQEFVINIIPEELRKAMGWEKEDELEFTVKNENTLAVSRK